MFQIFSTLLFPWVGVAEDQPVPAPVLFPRVGVAKDEPIPALQPSLSAAATASTTHVTCGHSPVTISYSSS